MIILKFFLVIALVIGVKLAYSALVVKEEITTESPIDSTWWNGLSDQWKNIFLINQNLAKHGVNIYDIQKGYVNRLNKGEETSQNELNTSLYDIQRDNSFSLSYWDFYARAVRENHLQKTDSIDLAALALLETVYMVNGPSDLSPLKKIRHLKVLIVNYGGMPYNVPLKEESLDLEPLKALYELRVLHCSSSPVASLKPIKNLVQLEDLELDNTKITSLEPLKKLVNLKRLSFGSQINSTKQISHLAKLEELYVKGCRSVSSISRLRNLKKLSISENELSIVSGAYRITSLDFLKELSALEYVDLKHTSYRGSLRIFNGLQNLKAVTLPRVSSAEVSAFKKTNRDCAIINGYEF